LGFDDSPARIIVVVLAIGFIPALILAWAFDKFVLAPQREAREQQQQTVELEVARQAGPTEALVESYGDKSIAVLPFTDMSPTCLRDQSGKPATISALLRNWSRPVQIPSSGQKLTTASWRTYSKFRMKLPDPPGRILIVWK